jgi:hypothetical protein
VLQTRSCLYKVVDVRPGEPSHVQLSFESLKGHAPCTKSVENVATDNGCNGPLITETYADTIGVPWTRVQGIKLTQSDGQAHDTIVGVTEPLVVTLGPNTTTPLRVKSKLSVIRGNGGGMFNICLDSDTFKPWFAHVNPLFNHLCWYPYAPDDYAQLAGIPVVTTYPRTAFLAGVSTAATTAQLEWAGAAEARLMASGDVEANPGPSAQVNGRSHRSAVSFSRYMPAAFAVAQHQLRAVLAILLCYFLAACTACALTVTAYHTAARMMQCVSSATAAITQLLLNLGHTAQHKLLGGYPHWCLCAFLAAVVQPLWCHSPTTLHSAPTGSRRSRKRQRVRSKVSGRPTACHFRCSTLVSRMLLFMLLLLTSCTVSVSAVQHSASLCSPTTLPARLDLLHLSAPNPGVQALQLLSGEVRTLQRDCFRSRCWSAAH